MLSKLIVLPCVGSERSGAKEMQSGTSESTSQKPGFLLEVCFQNFHPSKGLNTNTQSPNRRILPVFYAGIPALGWGGPSLQRVLHFLVL